MSRKRGSNSKNKKERERRRGVVVEQKDEKRGEKANRKSRSGSILLKEVVMKLSLKETAFVHYVWKRNHGRTF